MNDKAAVYRYDHYRRLRVREAWYIPELLGRFPSAPDANTTLKQNAEFAMFAMLLFRPWRSLKGLLQSASSTFATSSCKDPPSYTWALSYIDWELQ